MKKHTEEHNKHISEGMKGINLGRKFSEETKAKMKKSQTLRSIRDMEETSYKEISDEGFKHAIEDLYVSAKGDVIRVKEYEGKVYYTLIIPSTTKDGYKQVGLCRIRKAIHIHTLVMMTYVGPKPEGMEIDHIDRNKANNRLENLRYVTHQENMANTDKPDHHRYYGRYNLEKQCVTYPDGEKEYISIEDYLAKLKSSKRYNAYYGLLKKLKT